MCIDCLTCWIKPLNEIITQLVVEAFVNTWIKISLYIVTNRGSQFDSEIFLEINFCLP